LKTVGRASASWVRIPPPPLETSGKPFINAASGARCNAARYVSVFDPQDIAVIRLVLAEIAVACEQFRLVETLADEESEFGLTRMLSYLAGLQAAPQPRTPLHSVDRTTVEMRRAHLRALALVSNRSDPDALAFGDDATRPFDYDATMARSRAAWKTAELAPVGLHAARHTAASLMIVAGLSVKALSTFMGHSSITITLDRYGHLLPGSIAEATELLDAFLGRAIGARGEVVLDCVDS